MSLFLISITAAFAVMLVSLVGIIFTSRAIDDWMQNRLIYLPTFSAGVLTVLAYHLIEEALHEGDAALAALAVVAGIVTLEIIHHLLPDTHHHHEITGEHIHTQVDGRRVLISDSVHNVTDGFLIVPAFLADWRIGIAATVGIMLHELVQEVSEFFVLREAGYSIRKTLLLNFISSSSILLGVILALLLISSETLIALLSGLAAGGFLSVVIRDLLPHAFSSAKAHGKWLPHITAALIGIIVMTSVITIVPHEEVHDLEHEQIPTTLG